MQYRRRLRSRIILSFLIFGTVLSGLFAVSAFVLQDYITDQLISRTLKEARDVTFDMDESLQYLLRFVLCAGACIGFFPGVALAIDIV